MFRGSKTQKIKENALGASELALQLAQDKQFRKRLLSAIEHSTKAQRRARGSVGFAGAARRLAADQALRAELRNARKDLQQAYARLDAKRRSHRRRRITFVVWLASLAAVPQVRERVSALFATASSKRHRLQGLATQIRAEDPGEHDPRPRTLEQLTKEELYARAQEAEIPGRSEMSKDQLIAALRAKG